MKEERKVLIPRKITGLPNYNLVLDLEKNKFLKVSDDELENFSYLLTLGSKEFQALLDIHDLPPINFPQDRARRPWESILKVRELPTLPWVKCLGPEAFKAELEILKEKITSSLGDINLGYFRDIFMNYFPMLKNEGGEFLKPPRIDYFIWKFYINEKDSDKKKILESFTPERVVGGGFYARERLEYSGTGSRTGRITVVQGPNVLLLPKTKRNLLKTRFSLEGGEILSLDFSALEPMVLLYTRDLGASNPLSPPSWLSSTSPPIPRDLYQFFIDSLASDGISLEIGRDVVKELVLSRIYGAGYDVLEKQAQGMKDLKGFIDLVDDFFGIEKLKERLYEELKTNDMKYIKNFYGRPIRIPDASKYILPNYFTQSTAVDIALLAFKKLITLLHQEKLTDRIVPLFINHDALIVDVHSDFRSKLEEIKTQAERDVPGLPSNALFPIKISNFIHP